MQFLRALFGGAKPSPALPPLPAPDDPVCVIGDLHGMAGHLEAMLLRIEAQPGADRVRLVLAGDMIDRGPDSAATLIRARQLNLLFPDRVICLMGNHERMLLDFLADPPGAGGRWLGNGGTETLASFGVPGRVEGNSPAARFTALATALRAALPEGMEDWLCALPLYWQEGRLAVAHAGADPALPLHRQTEAALLWGHRDFTRHARRDGIWMVHGHVIHTVAEARDGRIAVDTGAFHSGILSAAWLDAEGLRFLTCTAEDAAAG